MAKKWQKKFGVPVLKSWKQPCPSLNPALNPGLNPDMRP